MTVLSPPRLLAPLPRLSPGALGVLAGLAAVAMWGLYLAFARAGVNDGLAAIDFVALRYGVAALVVLPWLPRRGLRDLGGVGWGRGAALAALAGPPFIALGVGGYAHAPLSHGAVVQPATLTLAGALAAWALLGERLGRHQIGGAALILAGVVLLARPGAAPEGAWRGDLMFAGAGLLFAAFTLLVRRWGIGPMAATAALTVVSAAVALPLYAALGDPARLLAVGLPVLLTQAVVQGVLSGVLAIMAFTEAVRRLGAARASLFPALVPAAALMVGIPVTGEWPAALDWAGMAVASGGLAVAVGALGAARRG